MQGKRYGKKSTGSVHAQVLTEATNGDLDSSSIGLLFHQVHAIPSTWVLLDNQSTVEVFCNGSFLENIRESTDSMSIQWNAGTITTNLVGDLPAYGEVWYHPNGIANIL
jgi:hypothetical protein